MCIDPYTTTEHQIRADAILSRWLYEEEKIQFKKELNRLETNKTNEYYVDLIGL